MEIKEIPINQIVPNPEQPRETFDREKLRELAESILSNGLINPITVRKNGNQYEIVAGERRWKAHQIAKIKTIPAMIKEYKSEGEVAIESLIENVHREDLTPQEKGKFLLRIKKIENISNIADLSRKVGISQSNIRECIDNYEFTKKTPEFLKTKHKIIRSTIGMESEDRKKIIKFAEKQQMSGTRVEEILMPILKKSTPEVKEALLNDKITVEQAERISKLKTEKERSKAIQEHQSLATVEKNIERNVKNQTTAKENREFDKRLVQAGNWIASFRGSVGDTYTQIEKTIKILLISTKFIPSMDKVQLEKLSNELTDFIEILERGEQLATQIKEKIE